MSGSCGVKLRSGGRGRRKKRRRVGERMVQALMVLRWMVQMRPSNLSGNSARSGDPQRNGLRRSGWGDGGGGVFGEGVGDGIWSGQTLGR